jgi:hypothetical protein
MEGGNKRVAGGVVAIMLVMQLMAAAPTTMASRLLDDGSMNTPVLSLNSMAREFGGGYCGETCRLIGCLTAVAGCWCHPSLNCVRGE